ncbi:class I SAM-dependent methyltransferase [Arthrobacter sp. TWP1-1]|uniref:class I SAM-dependent methyltransferase n=1 Tax=Arthrobacter sp. TWP1-1 TaxID=2804568 RepID=UPI003CF0E49D
MVNYSWVYRRYGSRATPWERYALSAGTKVAEVFDQELAGRTPPFGRALDLGCGRGSHTPELARRGWDAVGVDAVPEAIAAAQRKDDLGVNYVVGDVTELEMLALGTFELFVDIGCFQGLDRQQRQAMGDSVSALATPGATMLMLAFSRTRFRSMIEGVSREEIEEAFVAWETLTVWPAPTEGLGWPMNQTDPQWYRLKLREPA